MGGHAVETDARGHDDEVQIRQRTGLAVRLLGTRALLHAGGRRDRRGGSVRSGAAMAAHPFKTIHYGGLSVRIGATAVRTGRRKDWIAIYPLRAGTQQQTCLPGSPAMFG